MASRPPLRGYNHNIRYRNRVYHVQTEDSGLDNPHVFTHLFHGGVIIGTARTDYKDVVDQEGHEPKVQKRMQEQHKSLMKALRHGDYDEQIVLLFGVLEGQGEDGATRFDEPDEGALDATVAADEAPQSELTVATEPGPAPLPAAAERDEPGPPLAVPDFEPATEELQTRPAELQTRPAGAEPVPPMVAPSAEPGVPLAALGIEAITEEQPLRTGPQRDVVFGGDAPPLFEPDTAELPDSPFRTSADHPAVMLEEEPPGFSPIAGLDSLDPETRAAFEQLQAGGSTMRAEEMPDILDDGTLPQVVGAGRPPPLPRPSMHVGSDLPPLPIEEIADAPSWLSSELRQQLDDDESAPVGREEDTGRYQHTLRPGRPESGEYALRGRLADAEASQPDLNFRLKVGAGRRIELSEEAPAPSALLVEVAPEPEIIGATIIDRPNTADETSYSHVRRPAARDAYLEAPQRLGPSERSANPSERRASGVFERPLPKSAQVRSASQLLEPDARSEPPRAQPVQRPTAPRVHAVQGSTPQRYTAPSAQSKGRGRRATGSYESVRSGSATGQGSAPALRPPGPPRSPSGSGPAVVRPPSASNLRPVAIPTAPRVASGGAVPGRPRPPSSRHPTARPPAPPVVARPAVVVGQRVPVDVNPRKRSSSGVSIAAKGPAVPMAPPAVPVAPPKRPSQQTPRVRPRGLPNLFGSDLISERSLDEVILHYLAEDGEKKE